MHHVMRSRFLFVLIGVLLFSAACKRKPSPPSPSGDAQTTPPEKAEKGSANQPPTVEVTAHTSGEVSRTAAIGLAFSRDLVTKPGPVAGDLLRFDPPIPGKLDFVVKNQLRFTPDAPLPGGQLYRVMVDLSPIGRSLGSSFTFSFSTIQQDFRVVLEDLTLADHATGQGASGKGASGQGASGKGASGQGASGQGASGKGASGKGTSGKGTSDKGTLVQINARVELRDGAEAALVEKGLQLPHAAQVAWQHSPDKRTHRFVIGVAPHQPRSNRQVHLRWRAHRCESKDQPFARDPG